MDEFRSFCHERGLQLAADFAICRGIVESHEGRIWAENRDGVGTRFIGAAVRRPVPAARRVSRAAVGRRRIR